jgi:predicted outer membrane lipoprotein
MPEPTMTFRGNRLRLLIQAALIVATGAAAGLALQRWEAIGRSPLGRLDNLVPIPLIFAVVAGVAVAIAFAIVKDSWSHRVELRDRDFQIDTGRGMLTVPYSSVAVVRALPAFGVGIGLRDPDGWLEQISSDPGAPPRQRQISEVYRNAWGVDIAILQKNLDIDAKRLVELLQERTGPSLSTE